ncbi:MAG TPA: hypothetical protein VEY87_09265 [Gaiellaceae bacterium]|nr:hypothetical protein [Gaiellaceae bacterium]
MVVIVIVVEVDDAPAAPDEQTRFDDFEVQGGLPVAAPDMANAAATPASARTTLLAGAVYFLRGIMRPSSAAGFELVSPTRVN